MYQYLTSHPGLLLLDQRHGLGHLQDLRQEEHPLKDQAKEVLPTLFMLRVRGKHGNHCAGKW